MKTKTSARKKQAATPPQEALVKVRPTVQGSLVSLSQGLAGLSDLVTMLDTRTRVLRDQPTEPDEAVPAIPIPMDEGVIVSVTETLANMGEFVKYEVERLRHILATMEL